MSKRGGVMAFRKAFLFVALSCVLGSEVAHAQALPVASFAINRAEAAIISRVAIARGFAANDPRIAATLTGMGEASTALNVASTGASVALGFAGAPVWLTVAAGLGILAAGAVLTAGNVTLSRSFDGKTISAQQPAPQSVGSSYTAVGVPPSSDALQNPFLWAASMGIPVYHTSSCVSSNPCAALPASPVNGQRNFDFVSGDMEVIPNNMGQLQQFFQNWNVYRLNGGNGQVSPFVRNISSSVSFQANADGTVNTLMYSVNETVCNAGSLDGTCGGTWVSQGGMAPMSDFGWSVGPGVAPIAGTDLSQVYPQLSPDALSTPLDANTLAQITNQTWQQAASQPDYQGLPYPVTQPVSYPDVQPWVQSNPSAVPNVGDLFTPASNPGTAVVISPSILPGQAGSTNPASNPSPVAGNDVNVVNTPNVNVANSVKVDLGTDPQTASPSMESTPTISMILSPIINLFPDLKAWAVPQHTAVCPAPTLDVFGKTFTMSVQCDLAEQHRTAISTIFLAVFALAALFIVLGA